MTPIESTTSLPKKESDSQRAERGVHLLEKVEKVRKHDGLLVERITKDRNGAVQTILAEDTTDDERRKALHQFWALNGLIEYIATQERRAIELKESASEKKEEK